VLQRNHPEPGELTKLANAHACFRGIERPLAEDNDGRDVVAYILRPRNFYAYDPNMVSQAIKIPAPSDLVFVAYARLLTRDDMPAGSLGVLTHWGFVEAERTDPLLPVNHNSRYRTRLW
jgi:hypothetical protein